MKSPSDYKKRIVAMVDSFTKTVVRNFSRNLKRAKDNSEKHYSDEPVDYFLETLSHDDRYPSDHFVGQIATAGLGITLTAASTMVFYSLDYSMSNFEQTKARIHRVGQRMPCTYLYLVARGTVDEKVLAALESKADLARTLVDDYRSGRNPFAA